MYIFDIRRRPLYYLHKKNYLYEPRPNKMPKSACKYEDMATL